MTIAAFVVSLVSLGVALAFAIAQLRQSRIANAFPSVIGLFGEYRSGHVSNARTQVFRTLWKDPARPAPVSELPETVKQHCYTVCHYLDNFGVLVDEKLVDEAVAAKFLGSTAVSLWERLRPYIEAERFKRVAAAERGGADYLRYFEFLAKRLNDLNPEKLREDLERWAEPAPSADASASIP